MPIWNKISDETRLAIWRAWKEEGLTRKALAARFKYSMSAIDRSIRIESGKRHPKVVIVTPAPAHPPMTTALVLRRGVASDLKKRELIQGLRAQGVKVREIADRLNMKMSAVNHYLYSKHVKLNGGGPVTNGSLNKNVAVGIVYAEVERFLAALSQRLGVPTTVLRPRLSELLGRSPFRS